MFQKFYSVLRNMAKLLSKILQRFQDSAWNQEKSPWNLISIQCEFEPLKVHILPLVTSDKLSKFLCFHKSDMLSNDVLAVYTINISSVIPNLNMWVKDGVNLKGFALMKGVGPQSPAWSSGMLQSLFISKDKMALRIRLINKLIYWNRLSLACDFFVCL